MQIVSERHKVMRTLDKSGADLLKQSEMCCHQRTESSLGL